MYGDLEYNEYDNEYDLDISEYHTYDRLCLWRASLKSCRTDRFSSFHWRRLVNAGYIPACSVIRSQVHIIQVVVRLPHLDDHREPYPS